MKILFAHLLNNFTGSPKVLSFLLKSLSNDKNIKISLLTSKTDGILNDIPNVEYHDNFYRWHENKILRLLQFALSQVFNFFFALSADYDILYMNTVVPFGAALAAKVRGKKIIYHVHEVYINPGFLKRFYSKVMKKCASQVICVSKYVQEHTDFLPSVVVYNPIEFSPVPENLDEYLNEKLKQKIIFMPTSLKEYKGVFQFVELARKNIDYNFVLLCSTELSEMQKFFAKIDLPGNLTLVGKQKALEKFYREAAVTMNLSLYDKFIETFGLTVLESFDALVPAVAPAYGGPKEIIENGKNGFLINPYNLDEISESIKRITSRFDVYKTFALNAKNRAKDFSEDNFFSGVKNVIEDIAKEESKK